MTKKVAVIGSGVAGLSCARVLRRAGCFVEIFEKDRIIGGRMATTRLGLVPFDHGAQYITARSDRFKAFVSELTASAYAAPWHPKNAAGEQASQLTEWFVGTPGMSSIVRPLAEGVRLHTDRAVHTIRRTEKGWHLWFEDETSAGPFNAVAIATPPSDALLLLGQLDELAKPLEVVRFSPCWAVMARFEERILPVQDVFSDMSDVIRWVVRNNAKPGRPARGDHIVIHAAPEWSRETHDVEPDVIASELWNEVSNVLNLPPVRPTQLSAYLWRHGVLDEALGETYLFSSEHLVGVAGDWCRGRLAEHAFESGFGLGRAILQALD
ncbi:MAG: NAD(P)/FAD-dependent oxidoreductase [Hyphomicrobiaceae bacterium]